MVVAGSTAAVVDPFLVPFAVFGSILPDLAEKYLPVTGHRKETHYIIVWLAAFLFSLFIYDFKGIMAGITYGALTHVFTDALTSSGVPFAPWSQHRSHFFGGRLRTGSPGEYIISMTVLVISCIIIINKQEISKFSPFFYNYKSFYEEGIIDGYEWRQNRFRIF